MKPGLMILWVQSMILQSGGGAIVGAISVILLFWIRREDFVGVMLSLESWRRRVPFWRRIEGGVVDMVLKVEVMEMRDGEFLWGIGSAGELGRGIKVTPCLSLGDRDRLG
jgi:hypothetical protein